MRYLLKNGTIVEGNLTPDNLMIKVKTNKGYEFIEVEQIINKSENEEDLKISVISWQELEEASKPLKELLQKKGHPHMTIIIDQTGVEVLEGVCACQFELLDIEVKQDE